MRCLDLFHSGCTCPEQTQGLAQPHLASLSPGSMEQLREVPNAVVLWVGLGVPWQSQS